VRAARNLLMPGAQLVKVEPGQTVDDAITALEQRPDVRCAELPWICDASPTTPDGGHRPPTAEQSSGRAAERRSPRRPATSSFGR